MLKIVLAVVLIILQDFIRLYLKPRILQVLYACYSLTVAAMKK